MFHFPNSVATSEEKVEGCTELPKLKFVIFFLFSLHKSPHNHRILLFIIAGVLFIWGSLCVKLSHVHYAHNLLAKRLNILVLCEAIVLGIIQPELNLCRVS